MSIRIVVTVDSDGDVTVLSESSDVHVLVLDRDVAGEPVTIAVDGAPAATDSLLLGLPRIEPARVNAIYEEALGEMAKVTGKLPTRERTQMTNVRRLWARLPERKA